MIEIYTFHIITLGCRVNQYESRAIAEKLSELGLCESPAARDCDLYIINTCAVTAESARKSRQMIRRAGMSAKDPVVIVMGCWSQLEPQKAADIDCVDLVVGTGDKASICEKAIRLLKERNSTKKHEISVSEIDRYDSYSHVRPESVREYLKVEDGCDGKCAYCIIPKARGKVRSRKFDEAAAEARRLADNGVREIILTGIELSAYQYDLAELIKRIAQIDGIKRISMGSLDPSYLKEEFVSAIANIDKVTPHFHLSIQSGCSRTLAAMRRKYNAEMSSEAIDRLRRYFPDVMLTCDLIVGFPDETDEDFEQTVEFMRRSRFLHAHIFPYSPRPDTEAASMPHQIDNKIKAERLHRIEKIQEEITSELFNDLIDRKITLEVLVESETDGVFHGHSENFIDVSFKGGASLVGDIVRVTPISFVGEELICKLI